MKNVLKNMIVENKGFRFKVEISKEEKYYIIKGFDLETNEEFGYVRFFSEYRDYAFRAWLNLIKVEEKFQSKGAGNALLYLFEKHCLDKGIEIIEGRYFPKNQAAVNFYKTNNYRIYQDDYEQYICKDIQKHQILTNYNKLTIEDLDNSKSIDKNENESNKSTLF